MRTVQKALIVGGGIAGMTTAIALRAKGIDVDVVEKSDPGAVLGIGIILQGNALRALRDIGVLDKVLNAGFAYDSFVYFDADGSNPRHLPGARLAGADYPAMLGITRPTYSEILTTAARDAGASVRYHTSVAQLHDGPDKVQVEFTDSRRAEYDLVIGSDGIYSAVRELVFGSSGAPVFSGQGVWRVNFPRDPEVNALFVFDSGFGDKAGFVPLREDLMYMFVTDTTASPLAPTGDLTAHLQARLAPYGGLIGRYRDRLGPADKILWKRFETVDLPNPWFKGRAIVIGDGAHATTAHLGQGGAMAAEDGIVLAEELARPVALETALHAFMERRFHRANQIQLWSRQICQWEQERNPDANFVGLTGKAFEFVQQAI